MNRSVVFAVLAVLAVAASLASCQDKSPPAPSALEADQLNDAEDLLNRVDTNREGPADRSTGPSENLR